MTPAIETRDAYRIYESAAGGGLSAPAAMQQLVQGYHTNVAPFCALAARSFFAKF